MIASTSDLSTRDYRALARFRHALRVFQRFSEQAARQAGITPAHHQVLLAIRGHAGDDPPVVGDLADALQLRHHSVVELIDRAEAAGLVRRTPDEVDHRRQQVSLTATGRKILEGLSVVHRDELRQFRKQMMDVLQQLE